MQALVPQIDWRRDLDTLAHEPADALERNDIGRARLRLAADLPLEPYGANRAPARSSSSTPSDGATLAAGITPRPDPHDRRPQHIHRTTRLKEATP